MAEDFDLKPALERLEDGCSTAKRILQKQVMVNVEDLEVVIAYCKASTAPGVPPPPKTPPPPYEGHDARKPSKAPAKK